MRAALKPYRPWITGMLVLILSVFFYWWQNNKLQLFANAQIAEYKAPDAVSFEEAAHKFYLNGLEADLIRQPAYPMLIGVPLLFNISPGHWQTYIHLVNFSCWILSVLLLYHLLTRITNYLIGALGALLLATQVGLSALCNMAMSEPLFLLLLVTCCWLLYLVLINRQANKLPWLGLVVVLLYLTRPIFYIPFLAFVAVLVAWWLFSIVVRRQKLVHHKHLLFTLAIMGIIMSLHLFNMKRCTGQYTLSNVGSKVIYAYLGSKVYCLEHQQKEVHLERNRRHYLIEAVPYKERAGFIDSVARADLKYHLRNHPLSLFKTVYENIVYDNGGYGSANIAGVEDVLQQGIGKSFYERKEFFLEVSALENKINTRLVFLFFGICVLVLILFWSRPMVPFLAIVSAMGCYLVTISGITFWQGDRLHVITSPLTILVGCILLFHGLRFFRTIKASIQVAGNK